MKVLTVVGNRPQFVKAAAVSGPLRERAQEVLVHTGQHHDDELSRIFFEELGLPRPEHALALGGGDNTEQTARMLAALGPLLADERPDVVLVYGDTNSTLAGALAAAQRQIPVAHVEAGMRSFDRAMPEEVNRVLTDHLSALLLCSSPAPAARLRQESVIGRVEVVGDVMVDVARIVAPLARSRSEVVDRLGLGTSPYAVVTAHRVATVDDPVRLRALVDLLQAVPMAVVLPLHPRTRIRLEAAGLLDRLRAMPHVHLTASLGHLDFTALILRATAVLTDSGGVQKEAYLAGVPCVTLRSTTEWTETVDVGWNTLVDLDADAALAALRRPRPADRPELYGDGHAGARVVEAVLALGAGAAEGGGPPRSAAQA